MLRAYRWENQAIIEVSVDFVTSTKSSAGTMLPFKQSSLVHMQCWVIYEDTCEYQKVTMLAKIAKITKITNIAKITKIIKTKEEH